MLTDAFQRDFGVRGDLQHEQVLGCFAHAKSAERLADLLRVQYPMVQRNARVVQVANGTFYRGLLVCR